MILVTGPTGSGKSTTLYATLNIVNRARGQRHHGRGPGRVPAARHQPGAGRTPRPGLTFAAALRSILRSDPDIVLIGEIRDHETAQIAVEAALTGHLVLSTLHTNDAPSARHPPGRDGHRAVPRRLRARLRARPAARPPAVREVQGGVHARPRELLIAARFPWQDGEPLPELLPAGRLLGVLARPATRAGSRCTRSCRSPRRSSG